MKNYWIIYIDEFLLEKFINQWIWERMLEIYNDTFKLLLKSDYIDLSDLSTYTTNNFKKILWHYFMKRWWSSTTYNHYRKYFSSYCNFLTNEWYLQENPLNKVNKRKQAKKVPKTLTRDQLNEIIDNLDNAFWYDFIWLRNKTIFYTYLNTWLRLSELTSLKIEDLKINDWYIYVLNWKWNKERLIPLNKEIMKKLYSYLKQLKKQEVKSVFLFPTIYWNDLKKRDMKKIIDRLRYCISFYFTWHQLRHTFATELVRNNFDIYNISQILWHSNIDTTKIYLSTDTQKLKKQLDKIELFV